jgi:hypothetical protein
MDVVGPCVCVCVCVWCVLFGGGAFPNVCLQCYMLVPALPFLAAQLYAHQQHTHVGHAACCAACAPLLLTAATVHPHCAQPATVLSYLADAAARKGAEQPGCAAHLLDKLQAEAGLAGAEGEATLWKIAAALHSCHTGGRSGGGEGADAKAGGGASLMARVKELLPDVVTYSQIKVWQAGRQGGRLVGS